MADCWTKERLVVVIQNSDFDKNTCFSIRVLHHLHASDDQKWLKIENMAENG